MADNPVRLRFAHKVALVSGAGSGIGRAVAEGLAREGASVALLGRTRSKLEETAERLPPKRSLVIEGMHEDPLDAARAVRSTVEAFGGLDVLVNNAGVFIGGTAAGTTDEDWRLALANLTGPFLLTREALPPLRRRRGSIVNVGSTLGSRPIPGALPYAVSKAGLAMLTIATALEEAPNRVRVNAVAPGIVDTPILQRRSREAAEISDYLEEMGRLHPLGRVGKPEEVAAAIIFLASEDSAWTTGAVLPVDGGILIKNDK